ncbi:DUF6492 family protein [Myxosarcina sp. GI1]|uniref:DUF6492 family protein n=1 Tax=Myxosarcina sp. GI1 TaxID=1541065 RepID=UPI000565FDE3|nr:DUF6492 family protein [Myxosarcina sp. GI1]
MSQKSICLVTPSYAPDFERCQLLVNSIQRYSNSLFKHYIVVDRQDYKLFNSLATNNTLVLNKEDLLPQWIVRIPLFTKKNIWFSWKTLPLRGWLVQQLIKLTVANYVSEDVLVFADSDVFFIRPFDLQDYIRGDLVRFFCEPKCVAVDNPDLARWYYDASKLLRLEPPKFPVNNYMGQLIFWRKDNVLKLHRYLEAKNNRSWIEAICANWHVSEYILYGVFVEKILQQSGHYKDDLDLCHNYWQETPLSQEELVRFIGNVSSEQIATMISAKAEMPVTSYAELLS